MILWTHIFYKLTEPFMKLNYGFIEVNQVGVTVSIKDYYGKTVQKKQLSYEEMAFDESLLKYSSFCEAKSSRQQLFMLIEQFMNFYLECDLHMIGLMILVPFSIFFGLVAVMVRGSQMCFKRFKF